MLVWNTLHVLAMFIAFALTTGVGIFFTAIVSAGHVPSIRTAAKLARGFNIAGGITLLVGIIFGFATAVAIGFNLTSPWLIASYALAALILGIGLGVHRSWGERVAAAAAASPDDHMSPELAAVAADPLVRIANLVSGLLWIAVIAIMIVRPS